jgi:putative ATP-binding cassette transporter
MKTPRYLLRSAGALSLLLAPLGLAGAACSGALMATVHRALNEHALDRDLVLAFFGFGAGRIVAAYLSTVLLGDHAARSVAALRGEIVARLLSVPYRQIERLGISRVLSALTYDVSVLEAALTSVPAALTSVAMLVGGAAYLLYLSPLLFGALSLLVIACLFVFRGAARYADAAYVRQRAAHDRLWELYTALTQGTKELKLHAARRVSFLEGPLRDTTNALLAHDVAVRGRYAVSSAVNHALVLVVLAVVLFAVPQGSALRVQVASGYVLVGLYLMSPLATLSRMWPMFGAAEVSLHSLEELGVRLTSGQDETSADIAAHPTAARIGLDSVSYCYDDERKFTLGPVSLQLRPGEIVFVVGGNGSGKTTLGRVLAGLYAPDRGELRWDDQLITGQNVDLYRQLWSAVFSDVHLFDRLYGIDRHQLEERSGALIAKLGLQGVVSVEDGAFSSLALSEGQRKRLGLFVALLEDRPFCLFDEWAADQDPDWKRIFYRELLPELRARGKCVVVITHDDRYFDAADRVIALHDGEFHT